MFIRWQKRKQVGGDLWVAVLVESERVEGKPRQRHVAYLASILDSRIQHPTQRYFFWDKVRSAFDGLPDLPARERRAIERRIAEKVPALTKREIAAVIKRRAAMGFS
jgi:hypothetical protein